MVPVFASPRLPQAAEQFVKYMAEERGLKYSTAAKHILSILAIARFVHTMVRKTGGANASKLDASALDSLSALHTQC
eukprot:6886132-Prymnesium_polylepis.1